MTQLNQLLADERRADLTRAAEHTSLIRVAREAARRVTRPIPSPRPRRGHPDQPAAAAKGGARPGLARLLIRLR